MRNRSLLSPLIRLLVAFVLVVVLPGGFSRPRASFAGDPDLLEPEAPATAQPSTSPSPAAVDREPKSPRSTRPALRPGPKQSLKLAPAPKPTPRSGSKPKRVPGPKPKQASRKVAPAPPRDATPVADREEDAEESEPATADSGEKPRTQASPAAEGGWINLSGKLPPWADRVNALTVMIDGQRAGIAPVTRGTVDWRSRPLAPGAHAVSLRKVIGETVASWPRVDVTRGRITSLEASALQSALGTLVVELEYSGLASHKLASTFDVRIDAVQAAQKGTLVASDTTDGTTNLRYRFETQATPGTHAVEATLCDPQGDCRTKRFAQVKVARGQTTRVVHRWTGKVVLSLHGGVRDFDSECDCDGRTWTPAGR